MDQNGNWQDAYELVDEEFFATAGVNQTFTIANGSSGSTQHHFEDACWNLDIMLERVDSSADHVVAEHWGEEFTVGDTSCSTNGNGSGGYESLIIWPDGEEYDLDSGTSLYVVFAAWELVENATYLIEWSAGDMQDSNGAIVTLASGSHTFVADATGEADGVLASNISLADGCYDVWADLYDATDQHHFDGDSFSFCVGQHSNHTTPAEQLVIWPGANTYYLESGDVLEVLYEVDDLETNGSYLIEWDLTEDSSGNTLYSGSQSIDPTSASIGYAQSLLGNTTIQLTTVGCYTVWAGLYESGSLLVDDSFTFCVQSAQPTDSDGDGVADAYDECPGTAAGATVDAYGCEVHQHDLDGDGVHNDDDECPYTEDGVAVDATGCPESTDDDGDGVHNAYDECPETPTGTAVDVHGCPEEHEAGNETHQNETHENETHEEENPGHDTGENESNSGSGNETSEEDDGFDPAGSDGLLPGFTSVTLSAAILLALAYHNRRLKPANDGEEPLDDVASPSV